MTPLGAPTTTAGGTVCVLLDGRVLGEVGQSDVADLALKLRILKALGKENVCMNVAYVGYHTHRIGVPGKCVLVSGSPYSGDRSSSSSD